VYLEYFGLNEAPFSITPDPAFVYLTDRHRDALAHLLYGVGQGGSGGFVQLTGEVGTGKTTLCRCLLEQVPEDTRIALVLNPLLTDRELLAAICTELGVDVTGRDHSSQLLVDALNRYLLSMHEAGQRVVVVVDEAQNLSPEALEQIRLLTNLETSKEKLLQIVLLGQPELRELLQRRNLRQLAQRITARYHLMPLGPKDTAEYVRHRLRVAGARRNLFSKPALRALYQRSQGIPRLINIIADRALAGAYVNEKPLVDARLVNAAANEIQLGEPGVRQARWSWAVAVVVAVLLIWGSWRVFKPPENVGPEPTAVAQQLPEKQITSTGDGSNSPASVATPDIVVPPPQPVVLDHNWLKVQSKLAWRGLAEAWGDPADAPLIEAACSGQAGLGFACLRDSGNWSRVLQLGLPVVLELQDDGVRYLLLRGIDRQQLLLGTENDQRILTRAAVEPLWLGGFLVAWPQAANWPRQVGRGATGPAVETILKLARNTDNPYQGGQSFDADFETWLEQFQTRNGLEADGIVGPKTLLWLMRPSLAQPQLQTQISGNH